MNLTGRTAVVTGASSGIGAATARRLAEAGCNVVLAARRTERLQSLSAALGDHTLVVQTDVTDPEDAETLVSRTLDHFGGIDILVNNAGVGAYGSITDADPAGWRKMFDVNVLGVLYTTQAAARHMVESASGDIIFISSIAGRRVPRVDGTIYAATKHAVTAISEGLRMELANSGIRVTTVEPGLVRTEFPGGLGEDPQTYYAEREYRPLEAEDVAAAVLYAAGQPPHMSVDTVLVRPTEQPK